MRKKAFLATSGAICSIVALHCVRTREGEGNLSYLCGGWKRFYGHAVPKIGRRRGALPIVSG